MVCGDKQGTVAGRSRHYKSGGKPCEPCAQAFREYNRVVEKRRRDKDPEKYRAYQRSVRRIDRAKDPEKYRARDRAWREANKDRYRAIIREGMRKRRSRMKDNLVLPFTLDQLTSRLEYFGFLCWMCGAEGTTVDHVKPVAKGGAHILSNFRPACQSCNSSKQDKWPFDVRIRIGVVSSSNQEAATAEQNAA